MPGMASHCKVRIVPNGRTRGDSPLGGENVPGRVSCSFESKVTWEKKSEARLAAPSGSFLQEKLHTAASSALCE